MSNKVYENVQAYSEKREMTREELAQAAYVFLPEKSKYRNEPYDLSRLERDHCNCCGNGEFVLLPLSDEAVQSGMKRYMVCQKCGCVSHL